MLFNESGWLNSALVLLSASNLSQMVYSSGNVIDLVDFGNSDWLMNSCG